MGSAAHSHSPCDPPQHHKTAAQARGLPQQDKTEVHHKTRHKPPGLLSCDDDVAKWCEVPTRRWPDATSLCLSQAGRWPDATSLCLSRMVSPRQPNSQRFDTRDRTKFFQINVLIHVTDLLTHMSPGVSWVMACLYPRSPRTAPEPQVCTCWTRGTLRAESCPARLSIRTDDRCRRHAMRSNSPEAVFSCRQKPGDLSTRGDLPTTPT